MWEAPFVLAGYSSLIGAQGCTSMKLAASTIYFEIYLLMEEEEEDSACDFHQVAVLNQF